MQAAHELLDSDSRGGAAKTTVRQNLMKLKRPEKSASSESTGPLELTCCGSSLKVNSEKLSRQASSLRQGFAEGSEIPVLAGMKDNQLLRSSFGPHSVLH